jgi:signal transduction histidine kinase
MSLRLRLTLLLSATLALTLVGFGVAVYLTLAQITERLVKDALAGEAAQFLAKSTFSLEKIDVTGGSIGLPVTYVQTRDATGEPIARSANLGAEVLGLSAEGLSAVQAGGAWVEIMPKATKRLLVYTVPVKQGGAIVGMLQVARSLADRDDALATLRTLLAVGVVAATLVTLVFVALLTSAALRPLAQITGAARALGLARDFARRVPNAGRSDEVGTLAATLNTTLAELEQAHQHVARALEAQRRFVADASHELRTPLTTVRGNLDLLAREPPIDESDRRAALADTIAETDRLIRLVNDLFLLARADAGRPSPAPAPFAVAPLIEALRRQAQTRDPSRLITAAAAPDLQAWGDRDASWQVLTNLVDNALRHTPPGTAIHLAASREGERVSIAVTDTGPGIPANVLPHLFERFFRADQARSGEGAGLGLAIARALAEAQGGTLTVESAPGRGSTFRFALPATVAEPSDVAPSTPAIVR